MFDENAHVKLVMFSKAKSFKNKLTVKFIREVGCCAVLQCTFKRSLVVDVSDGSKELCPAWASVVWNVMLHEVEFIRCSNMKCLQHL